MNYRQTGRPARDRAADDRRGGQRSNRTSVPRTPDRRPEVWQLIPEAQEIVADWYGAGLEHSSEDTYKAGYLDGWAACREWLDQAAQVSGWANALLPTYAELCRRRGEHERAEANERLLRERGIIP